MRIKETIFKLGSLEDFDREVLEAMKKEEGDDRNTIYVKDLRIISRILTPRRLQLLKALVENPGIGVNDLAKLLSRKIEAVSRDISYLRSHGIIDTKTLDRKTVATAAPGKVVIEI